MIPQVTAAALASENKQRSIPHLDADRHLHPDVEKAIQLMRPAAAIAAVDGRLPGVVEGVR